MKYVFIEKHRAEFSVKAMCRVFQVAAAVGMFGGLAVIRSTRVSGSDLSAMMPSARRSIMPNSGTVPHDWLMSYRTIT